MIDMERIILDRSILKYEIAILEMIRMYRLVIYRHNTIEYNALKDYDLV